MHYLPLPCEAACFQALIRQIFVFTILFHVFKYYVLCFRYIHVLILLLYIMNIAGRRQKKKKKKKTSRAQRVASGIKIVRIQ